jgi:hypothetical protein
MALYQACDVDNRDVQETYVYLEARIETMRSRIRELERENQILRSQLASEYEA